MDVCVCTNAQVAARADVDPVPRTPTSSFLSPEPDQADLARLTQTSANGSAPRHDGTRDPKKKVCRHGSPCAIYLCPEKPETRDLLIWVRATMAAVICIANLSYLGAREMLMACA